MIGYIALVLPPRCRKCKCGSVNARFFCVSSSTGTAPVMYLVHPNLVAAWTDNLMWLIERGNVDKNSIIEDRGKGCRGDRVQKS